MQVTTDGGATWRAAHLEDPVGRWAWRRWTATWEVDEPGRYLVSARAADSTGRSQPADPDELPWNRGGFANTGLQLVDVVVPD